jgi:nucleoside-diphosphate-sugar epimerase
MLLAMEKYYECDPLNLGSGVATSIREVVEIILRYAPHKPRVEWDTRKPTGNRVRLMDMARAREKIGFHPEISLDQGMKQTIEWFLANQPSNASRLRS